MQGSAVSLKAIEASLRAGFEPVYIVLGEAAPLVERARAMIEAAVRPTLGPAAFNHSRYRAAEPGAATAFTAARTLPMMADRRLVEVRDLDQAPTEVFEGLIAYLAEPSPSSVLLVVGAGFPKVEKGGSNWGARVKSALKKGKGAMWTFGADAAPPARFAVEVAAGAGKTLAPSDANRLVQVVGSDLGRIEQEVLKLCTFVGDAPAIDAEAIAAAGSVIAEAVIWDLTAGLAARDAGLALEALHRLEAMGDDPRKLLGMIAWQMRDLLRVAELVASGASDGEITSQVRIRSDMLRKLRANLGPNATAPFPSAADLLRRLATANRQFNSHRAGADRVLEGMVLEMLDGRIRVPPPVPRPR